ncbi:MULTISPECIES: Arm DNA-binding domain-containing protein [Escherichia]|uniref:Arm DNA-binding domain-containing protein n=1 Tax=Escherichia TaxID=561 RepID=UPI0027DA9C49|nr:MULTISPECIES: Arm DNA-binding domain-containing protein [Escherichia]
MTIKSTLRSPSQSHLTVSTCGSKLWYFRYSFSGKESSLAFGPYQQITQAEARKKRDSRS